MYGFNLKMRPVLLGTLVCLSAWYSNAQINNPIWFKYCVAHPHPYCFNPTEGAVDSVGRDVFELGGGYKFCMKIDTVDAGFAPIRVILVLDNSGSMCSHYGPGRCCVAGDGSGNCSRNDPFNKRVDAANLFVDNLRTLNPQSEVGVIVYSSNISVTVSPTALTSESNVTAIHNAINRAGCTIRDTSTAAAGGLAKTTIITTTNLGLALEHALIEIDTNYQSMPKNMMRHIVLLTDGAWDDKTTRSPKTLIDTYKARHTDGRTVPVVHGVFISDSLTHVTHGYPAEGCAESELVDLTHLASVAEMTGGLYFGGSTPQTVVDNFATLLRRITHRVAKEIVGMIVTNVTTGEVRRERSLTMGDTSVTDTANYFATLDNLPLKMGINTLKVEQIQKNPGTGALDTIISTVKIYRAENWTTKVDPKEYDIYCVNDSTTISIKVTPAISVVNTPFTADATIKMKDKLIIDTVQVRLFTQFPNDAPNTKALFHLENNLDNAAVPGGKAIVIAQPSYNKTDTLFGQYVMSAGVFQTNIGTITGDFALEAWIRPSSTVSRTDIFSGNGFSFGIGADRILYFTATGAESIRSRFAVDANTWSHVAVSRASGTVRIFINGVDASAAAQFTGAIDGAVTIACPVGGLLDEVRISEHHRMSADPVYLRLDIPSLQNPTWTINGRTVTQTMVTISPELWNNGNIQFHFSCPVPGQVVVNLRHLGPVESQWSKNGNSVYAIGELQPVVSIKVTPDTLPVNKPFKVEATIILKPWIVLDTVEVRVFTQFPDNDPATKAVFHLDRDLSSTTGGTGTAIGAVVFTATNAAFGAGAMSRCSFETSIGNITGDFALEAWIYPSNTVAKTDLFSRDEFSFGIGDDRLLYFSVAGSQTVMSAVAVDANTWSHVALSRSSGVVRVYLNGVDVTPPVEFGNALLGTITVSCPTGGLLDEIRISSSSRMRPDPIFNRLDIPSLQQTSWIIAGVTLKQPVLMIPPGMWSNGNLQFQFSSPIQGKLIVNFQHKGDIQSQWSKNGNVVFAAGDLEGPYVKKAIFTTGPLGDVHDTLKVIFSEPVRCDSLKKNISPSESFKIFGPDNAEKKAVFDGAKYVNNGECPSVYITEVTIITRARVDGIVPKKDSILLYGIAVDTAGNRPDTTRRGPIEPGKGLGVTIIPYQNASDAPMIIPQGIKDRTGVKQNEGKIILIQTRNTLVPSVIPGTNEVSYAHKTVIYDAVGNVVAVDLPLLPFPNNYRLYYVVWDGTNLQKRRVASGAYLFQGRVAQTDEPEKFVTLQCKFSIKWKSGK